MNSIRTFLAVMAAGLLGATVLRATDWTTTDGKVYQDVKLIHLDTDSVTILYTDGGARIPLDKLPANLQQRFGYDPEAAKAAAEARAKESAVNAKALQAEMDQASAMRQAGTEPVAAPPPATDEAATSITMAPVPVYNTGTQHFNNVATYPTGGSHISIDETTQAAAAMRPNLADPNYHTMSHMFYTVKSLGPDPKDKGHHTIDQAVNAVNGQ